jgi:Rps23 Pro-64 3,4-dihydroxylase Tpa1-like proline 4-hydroxylase
MTSPLRLADDLDGAAWRGRLEARRRVHITQILEPASADRLHATLAAEPRWNLVTTINGRHVDLDAAGMDSQSAAQKDHFRTHVYAPARASGFQYLFENVPIYDLHHKGSADAPNRRPWVSEVYAFLNSAPVLAFVRRVTGADDIGFADAQATRYRPGHFLTEHDDDVSGKNRRAAYVLNLTPDWRADWGGLTLFIGADGHVEEAFTPRFNALNIFLVPQSHAVSVVAPFAPAMRYSITGWFRAGVDPGP